MSCYEWENGTIKLPTKIFAKFRREYINGHNDIQLRKLNKLKICRELALSKGKGKRGFNFEQYMLEAVANSFEEEQLVEKLFNIDGFGKRKTKPAMPTKKMFDFVNGKDNSFDVGGDAGIGFNKESHSVSWSVFENNHACESAHEHQEAKLFFRMLSRVVWTRGSGGVIVGNDEYNRDDYNEGGGGNYTKMTFGNRK